MHFTLVKPALAQNTESDPANGLDDVILPMSYALSRLGYDVETRIGGLNPHSVNILFGAGRMAGSPGQPALPANSIIFNLERMYAGEQGGGEPHIELLRRFTVWDYSRRNAEYLRDKLGLGNAVWARLGYVPEMTRLDGAFPQDIDVLFYGTISERRRKILEGIGRTRLHLLTLQGKYGMEREYAIARAKLVLNVHQSLPATLETPRLGYLWANRKAVVSETAADTELDPGLERSCRFCPYDELVPAIMELALSESARREQAEKGFAAFSALRQEDFLESLVGRRAHAAAAPRRPDWLNAGSNQDFRPECLNVDINPAANPDLVLDLSQTLDPEALYHTDRFGPVRLEPGSFSRIIANELLEHVRDLPRMMRNFLDLLVDGGELHITVPYDLSCGAWQDPTHIRGFNEKSWNYYTSFSWYLGWREECFDLTSLIYVINDSYIQDKQAMKYGEVPTDIIKTQLAAQGLTIEKLMNIPRAIQGMNVKLRKRKTTQAERENYDLQTRRFYGKVLGEWSVK